MKTLIRPFPVILLGVLAASACASFAEDRPSSKTPPPAAAPASTAEPAKVHTGASTFGQQTDNAAISTPPPAPRAETKPAAPSANHVWVRGYYQPVKGEWQWRPGVWAIPATPQSVWIDGSYDPNSKRWSEGHWQPDGKMTQKTDVLQESGPPKKQ